MEAAVEKLAVVAFVVIGLSHLLQPKAWARFFMGLHALGDTGNFINAMLTLSMGAIIVGFHPVWSGVGVVLTVIGWLQVVKSAVYLLVPSIGLKSIGRVNESNAGGFRVAGGMMLAVATVLAYGLLAQAES